MKRSEQARIWLASALLAASAGALAGQPFGAMGATRWLADRWFDVDLALRAAGAVIAFLAAAQVALAAWLVASRGADAARWAALAGIVVLSAPLVYLVGWGADAGRSSLDGLNIFTDARWNAGAGLARIALVAVLMAPGKQQLAEASPDSSPVNS